MEDNTYILELLQQHKDQISANLLYYKDDFLFEKEMDKLIDVVCTDKEAFNFYSLNYHEALKEARTGNVQKAEILAIRAKKYIDFDSLQIQEKHLYELISLPIQAFLSYKKTNYILAKQQTYETMLFDEKLEQYNSSIACHKIQQLHNIARIEMKELNTEYALEIFNSLYRCLMLSEKVTYRDVNFYYADRSESLKKLRKLMLVQITNEYIPFLDQFKNKTEILDRTFGEILLKENTVKDELKSLLYWVKLKKNISNHEELSMDLLKKFIAGSTDYTSTIAIDSLHDDLKVTKPMTY
ncbi:hypothetical protein C1631_011500 [Chryseobacterium phosphatilyticum]|uniref:Uncharacterized protein n=1 Tax=Chryseobacterium phosphatilyticum TaxID=475075 RepID=A0A316XBN2_9FLAO|nr:hypothetical protein [Chryseobacterium phosphatilyticum]PWN70579.1 hypothetical protein C1631_011500 [Chryseobacterium phosphatilyticum]